MKLFLEFLRDNRTKNIGYIGMLIASLGTSGLVSPKAALWCGLISSAITAGIGHFNDWKARRDARLASATEDTGDDVVIPGDPQ